MTIVQVNGKMVRFEQRRSVSRRSEASFFQDIFKSFGSIGIERNYIQIATPAFIPGRGKEFRAVIVWFVNGQQFSYTSESQPSYLDNLGIIARVIEMDCYAIRYGLKSFGMVMSQYLLTSGASRSPREVLGVPSDIRDLDYITYKYKTLSKQHHPDVPGGSAEKFKELTEAYEALKRELA